MRLLLPLLLLLSAPSFAQDRAPCAPLSTIESALAQKYGEHVAAAGKAGQVSFTLFLSKGGKTWTLLMVGKRDGALTGCVLGAGTDWAGVK